MNRDNKFEMYKRLNTWIDIGQGTADMIYDSPFQNVEYAPYVVVALLKNVPKKQIPSYVLDEIGKELGEMAQPQRKLSWLKRLLAR